MGMTSVTCATSSAVAASGACWRIHAGSSAMQSSSSANRTSALSSQSAQLAPLPSGLVRQQHNELGPAQLITAASKQIAGSRITEG